MIRTFSLNLALTLLTCVSLFYLFTFFELVDDMVANNATYTILFEYFFYLLPHVLMMLVPISILISTLVTFGVLEKTSQTIAFKACGISVYRLATPVILLAVAVCGAIFVLQDYVLPFANQRQDSLRNVIKGRPIQTSYRPGRNWILGEGNRLYNYSYFDPEQSLFAELSIYEFEFAESELIRHTYGQRALWNSGAQAWELSNGWTRNLQQDTDAFTSFESQRVDAPEKPDYFLHEVQESIKMTYLELDTYVDELQRGGFEVDHLRTELHRKIAFPVVSLVMVVLGVPFAFSVGRKGALYGIAAGALIGIVYWGAFGVFGVFGNNGLLSPLLAAWGPNLLFGTGSILLFMNVKT